MELLTSMDLKNQIKSQIQSMLEAKGISFDKITTVFENVYNQSAQDTLNSKDMITGRGARGLSSKGKAYIDIKNLVDTFITTFNSNIETAINTMNKSGKDMDIVDLDFTQAGKFANGTEITDPSSGKNISQLYAQGQTITVKNKGSDYYISLAEVMIDNMRAQMLTKAMTMCEVNCIEFDESQFETIFNEAKKTAVSKAVSGKGKVSSTGWNDAVLGGGAGATAGVFVGCTTTGASLMGSLALSSSFIGGIGIAVGAVAALTFGIASLFGGSSSSCSLNPRELLDTFTEQFKYNYSIWIDTEIKNNQSNKNSKK